MEPEDEEDLGNLEEEIDEEAEGKHSDNTVFD